MVSKTALADGLEAWLAQAHCWSETSATHNITEVPKLQQQKFQHKLAIKLNLDPFTGAYVDRTEACINTHPLLSASQWE